MKSIMNKSEHLAEQVNYEYSNGDAVEELSEWSDNLAKANPTHYEGERQSESAADKKKRLEELDEIVKEDIKHTKRETGF